MTVRPSPRRRGVVARLTSGLTPPPSPLHVVGALAGAGGEAVVQRVTQGANRIRPRLTGEAGGGRLVLLAAVRLAFPRIPVGVASPAALVRVEAAAARAAVIQLVQGLQGEVKRARLVRTYGRLLQGNLLLQGINRGKHVNKYCTLT